MYVLDTDHVSLDQRGHPYVTARVKAAGPPAVASSMITVEEQLRGWLAAIRAAKTATQRSNRYAQLRATVEYFATILLLDYDQAADRRVEELRRAGIRIGTQDVRIAAIALTSGATLVTRNARDFQQVPGLTIVDWSQP